MNIISHRGYWNTSTEKNSESAFLKSFSLNYGTETDVRDHLGELVISHDAPKGNELSFLDFLSLANTSESNLPLAINIKADGLAPKIFDCLNDYKNLNVFVFDMSIPDMRSYFKLGIPIFTRMSEVERDPIWLSKSAGVWLDAFEYEWYSPHVISDLLNSGKQVCVVSPELHGRDFHPCWNLLKPLKQEKNLLLCTDFPEVATKFFSQNQ
jgi:hypothetical protein